jgi:hypothetical protein
VCGSCVVLGQGSRVSSPIYSGGRARSGRRPGDRFCGGIRRPGPIGSSNGPSVVHVGRRRRIDCRFFLQTPPAIFMDEPRDGQTDGPTRHGPGPVKPGQNRAGPDEPTGSVFCLSPVHSGPKRAGPTRLARKKRAEKRAKRAGKHVLVLKNGLRGKRIVLG